MTERPCCTVLGVLPRHLGLRITDVTGCSLLNRLPSGSKEKPSINEIQPDLDPLEVLFDVKKLIDEENVNTLVGRLFTNTHYKT